LGGTDFSQQNSAQVLIDNISITASTAAANSNVITFTGYTPTAADVGNLLQTKAGGSNYNFNFFEIVGFSSTTWTVTGSVNLTTSGGAATGILGSMGGALANPQTLSAALVGGNRVWIKSGTYTNALNPGNRTFFILSSTSTPSSTQPPTWVSGYFATRGDIGFGPLGANQANRPLLAFSSTSSGTGLPVMQSSMSYTIVENLGFDSVSNATASGLICTGTGSVIRGCFAKNFANNGFQGNSDVLIEYCEAFGGTTSTSSGITANGSGNLIFANTLHDNAGSGVQLANLGNAVVDNIFASNLVGITATFGLQGIWRNTFEGNTTNIKNTGTNSVGVSIKDNVFASSTTGIQVSSGGTFDDPFCDGNSYWSVTTPFTNVTSGALTALPYTHQYDITLSADPCVSHTSGTANFPTDNFSLVVGSGARSATWLTKFPGNIATTNYADMGAVQSQAAAAGVARTPNLQTLGA
jgi:hypothetical protein